MGSGGSSRRSEPSGRANPLLALARLFRAELGARRWALIAASAVLLAQVGAELLAPWALKVVVDNVIRERPLTGLAAAVLSPVSSGPYPLLLAMVIAMVVLAGAAGLLDYRAHRILLRTSQELLLAVRRRIYGHLQRLSFAFHTRQSVGDLTARVTTDVNALQDVLTNGLRNLVTNALLLVGMLAVMLTIDWRFTALAMVVLPPLGWLVLRYKPRVKRAASAAKKREREMASLAQETLVSYRVVQAFAAEEFEDKRFASRGEQAMAARLEAGEMQARFAPAVDLTVAAGTALVVGFGAHRALEGQLSVGTLLVFLTYLKSMYAPMKQLAKAFGQLTGAAVSSELLVELLETDARVAEQPGARPAPRLKGEVRLEHVCFAYEQGRAALDDVSLALRPGEHCVVVGSTGAGKSTLVSLIPRFIDPERGAVYLDGTDVREFTLRSLREQIAIVLQEAMLFRMTVRENIAYAMEGATEERIVAAAKAANAHEFIERLPQGYDTLIDERGGNLSGGQRQRLTLARAFLRDAPILLLDEPTASLDLASEQLVLEALDRLVAGRTTVTIAHRLSTIERADRVVVLEAGRVVDTGRHSELLARCPRYRQLYQLQLGPSPEAPPPEEGALATS